MAGRGPRSAIARAESGHSRPTVVRACALRDRAHLPLPTAELCTVHARDHCGTTLPVVSLVRHVSVSISSSLCATWSPLTLDSPCRLTDETCPRSHGLVHRCMPLVPRHRRVVLCGCGTVLALPSFLSPRYDWSSAA